MNNEDLIQLRELFRKKFREHDFCIGEEQVERVFRELLNEPEPINEYHSEAKIDPKELERIIDTTFGSKEKLTELFNRDDAFFRTLKNKT